MRPFVLIVGHGSRDPSANEEFTELVAQYQARRADLEFRHAYLELAEPSLSETLAHLPFDTRELTLLPLFLFAAGHVKRDIPAALATAHRRRRSILFRTAPELGVHPALVELAWARGEEALPLSPDAPPTAIVVVGRGSSDDESNAEFRRLTGLIGESRGWASVWHSYLAVARPRLPEVLETVVQAAPGRLLVIPYLLFGGRLVHQLREQVDEFRRRHPQVETALARPLGADDRLFALLDERLAHARIYGSSIAP